MPSKRTLEATLSLLSISMLLIPLFFPVLRVFFVAPSQDLINKVESYLTQFDYFYVSKEKLSGNWSYKVDSLEHGNVNVYYDPSYNDSCWSKTHIPFLFKAMHSNSSIWIRKSFTIPESMRGQRLRLIFSRVWMTVKIWLNGVYLGDHVGYFSSFFFDIDDSVILEGVNVLTLYLESPVQSYETTIYPMGIYSSSEILAHLNNTYIGILGDVTLVGTLNPVVNLVLVDVKQYRNPALLSFRVLIQNKGGVDENPIAVLRIKKPNSNSMVNVEQSFNLKLSAGERKWITWEIPLPDPAYWFPWDVGTPNTYLVNISLYCGNDYAGSLETLFGIRSLEGSISVEKSYIKINEINIFLRGGSYFSKLDPSANSSAEIESTLMMLKDANINFLRTFSHVESKEFYELTSKMGLSVQLDFPLIGSYPLLDYSEYYAGLVKTQLVELLLLIYNYPSIIIVCPHTLPGWVNKESAYYNSQINFYLDRELRILVEEVNKKVIVTPYSEYYERYVDYGWGTGSWVDYFHYKEVFPNIMAPASLPSPDSYFWRNMTYMSYEQILELLKEKGLDPRFQNTYLSTREIGNLTDLIRLSQTYQSLVLREAIDRIRILKNNISVGVNILPLTEFPLFFSGSVVDYGSKKSSYYEIKNAFNPVHTIISVDGNYRHNLTSLYFLPGSTIRVCLWLVNDAFQESLDAILDWKLIDLTSNKSLVNKKIDVKLPSSSSSAVLAEKYVFEAPHYYDIEHTLEISTELCFVNGTKIDESSKRFIVKPSSLLKLYLNPKPMEPQTFLIFINETYMVAKISNETVVPVPSNSEVMIVGPSLNERDVYVPQVIALGSLSINEVKNVTITLYPGAIAKVLAAVPSPFDLAIPLQEMYIRPITEKNLDGFLLDYDTQHSSILALLNITGNTAIVPAETNLSILVSIKVEEERFDFEVGNSSQPVRLDKNVKIYLDHPALTQVRSYQRFIDETVEFIKRYLKNVRNRGFYVGLELCRLEYIEKNRSTVLNSSDPMKTLAYQQEAMVNSILINDAIKNITREVYAGQIMVSIIATLLALSISAIFSEKKEQYATFLMITFIIFMTISYQLFPSLSRPVIEPQNVIPLIIFLIVITFLIALLAPYFPEIKSKGEVSLIPALLIAVSYSIGSLKKRKLRTVLALVSITLMIMSISSLTSISVIFTTNSIVTSKTWPADRVPMLMVTKHFGPFTTEDLGFIGAQKEILKIGYKVITPVAYGPLDYVGEIPIYGVRGISPIDPSIDLLRSVTYPERSIEKLFNDSSTVLISRYLANSADIDVGMTIIFRGVRLKVVGIFDGKQVDEINEPNDNSFQPLYFLTGFVYGPEPVPSNHLLITNVYTAQKLDGYISSIYCTFEDNVQAKEVSKRLASLGNYSVFAMPSSENIIHYFKEGIKEIFGTSVLIPILITMLNIMFLFYTLVYERKNEIFVFSCVGLNPTHIFSLFIVEAGVMGFIGGSIGYILSMIIFKAFDIFNLIVPVNIKSSPSDMLFTITITALTAIISSTIPALKAAKITTPSLLRRWKMEEKIIKEGTWSVQLPVRIPPEKVEIFTNYLCERLSQSSIALELSISNLKHEEKADDKGNILHLISFSYEKGGNRPFSIHTTVEIKREDGGYITYVHTKSPYTITLESNVYEVVNHVRKVVIEWSTLRFNLAIVMGESIEQILTIIKQYQPRFVQVYSREDIGVKLRELRRRLRSEGVWPPTIQVRKIETKDIRLLAEKLSEDIMSIDAVCLDSDDGLLSSALLIAAIRLDKNILLFDSEGKAYEMPARKIVENLKH